MRKYISNFDYAVWKIDPSLNIPINLPAASGRGIR